MGTSKAGAKVIWLTGLPCAGKTTLARQLAAALELRGAACAVLDGDELRAAISPDLGFSKPARDENVRRAAALAAMLAAQDLLVIVALVSPYREARGAARSRIEGFVEVFVSCPLDECERRDTKGMYAAARAGKIPAMTGVDDPYEAPTNAEVVLHTERQSIEECVGVLLGAVGFSAEPSA